MAQMTAEDVLRHTFATTEHGGYDVSEVDAFLDTVAAALADLTAQVAAAAAGEPAAASSLLALAARMHDEHIGAARAQADEILATARQSAADLLSQAQETADRQLGDLEGQRQGLQATIDELTSFESTYRAQLRATLSDLLERVQPTQD